MTDIFVSYRRADIDRVRKLVGALEDQGFEVWWDQELAGGDNWRRRIEDALDKAKTVVAVWSEESVGHSGGFVRDEATRALAENRLVPCRIDEVDPPLGFGEVQAIDLAGWNGRSSKHPAIAALAEAVRAKIEGREPQIETVIRQSKTRRGLKAAAIGAAALLVGGAALDVFSSNSRLCSVNAGISDMCGSARLGGRPTRAERLAWNALPDGDCSALRQFISEHPQSAFRSIATDLYAARETVTAENWAPVTHRLPLYVSSAARASASQSAARADALDRGNQDAARSCRNFVNSGLFRFSSAEVQVDDWLCASEGGGVNCAIDGYAICRLEEQQMIETESCDIAAYRL